MKYNTRFNPTVSGASLHCGHLYVALVNANEAHRSGGKFILRIDDTQSYWNHVIGKQLIDQFANTYREQLGKFMIIDKYERQSNLPSIRDVLGDQLFINLVPPEMWNYDQVPEWTMDKCMTMYPYTAQLTLERVAWDFLDRVNWLIRGEDLVTEFALYCFFVDMLKVPRMRHTYLPKLRAENRAELLHLDVSKTLGSYRLEKQIDRFGVEGTLDLLKRSCLIDYDKDFYVDNIKWNPTVVGLEP